jgi:hypothetical protein
MANLVGYNINLDNLRMNIRRAIRSLQKDNRRFPPAYRQLVDFDG